MEMRLVKKTTATLLVAILIAVAGVISVLAYEPTPSVDVPIEVTVEEIEVVSISVIPIMIYFPAVTQGGSTEEQQPVVITNDGNVPVTINAYVSGGDIDKAFFDLYLYTSPDTEERTWTVITGWNKADHIIPYTTPAGSESLRLKIDMGGDIPDAWTYYATLVFFAEYHGPS